MRLASPLRYPGGKWRLSPFFENFVRLNVLEGAHYVEPYAGGGSLALSLLYGDLVSEIHLNDLDRSIFAFWRAALQHNRAFVEKVLKTPISIKEWEIQKEVHRNRAKANYFDLGFATFYLNRTNRSGILNAGIIGGKSQIGNWKIDARFNKAELAERLASLARHKSRIHITNLDALNFMRGTLGKLPKRTIAYLDPPYYEKGQGLYYNAYKPNDHENVRNEIIAVDRPWIVSYDDVGPVRKLYKGIRSRKVELLHTARSIRTGSEVMFFSPQVRIPRI